ncbi:L-lactate dehydrogenase complex protein LldG [Faunimonas pinastri]|uniref:L-lactate dehydrogenase complex protein LldG n=1 Tax=Faunimonas pinastri TaxID=1855383 RepID=A0A1H8ZD27_9HYPH|nr:LUD domain-containing protein [Faunimonas pinastri]SEP62283.1 L-lactate dehydrogenase complex protein LldG [Faunimonas pinastri]
MSGNFNSPGDKAPDNGPDNGPDDGPDRGRAAMLSTVRAALRVTADDEARHRAVAERLAGKGAGGPRLSLGDLAGDAAVVAFAERAEFLSASVEHVGSAADVSAAVASALRARNLPARVVTGSEPVLAEALAGLSGHAVDMRVGPAGADDTTSVTLAAAAVAETGVLMLAARPETPTTLNFLPEFCVCLIPRSRIVGSYEDAFALIRQGIREPGSPDFPRVVNFVGGPSRTADIEEILQIGAHGPKAVHIIVVDSL